MSSLEFNFNRAIVPTPAASGSDQRQGLEEKSETRAASTETRVASAFGLSSTHNSPSPPTTSTVKRRVNFLEASHVNSSIISFLNIREILCVIKLISTQARDATRTAIKMQLSEKKSLTFKEIVGYQRYLRLKNPAEVLPSCVNQKGESKLTHLDLSHRYGIGNRTNLLTLTTQLTDLISFNLPNLNSLDLSGCDRLTDDQLKELFVRTHLISLTSLDLSGCPGLTNDVLGLIALQFPNLTSLNLKDCNALTDDALRVIAERFPNLTSLNLAYCGAATVEGLRALDACKNLTSLNLSHCGAATVEGLEELASCKNLTSLNLAYCGALTDDALRVIVEQFPNLTSLDLTCCNALTDDALRVIAERFPNLTSLNLAYCHALTVKGFGRRLAQLSNLTSLNFSHCGTSTIDEELKELAACKNLISLNLSGCYELTNEGLRTIATQFPNLTFLDLSLCQLITDKGLRALDACTKLTFLRLASCHGFQEEARRRALFKPQ